MFNFELPFVFLGVSMIHQRCGVDRFGRKTTPIIPAGILVTTRIVSMNTSGGPMIELYL